VREVLLRLEELLFLSASEIRVVSVQDNGDAIRVGVRSRTARTRCPGCGSWSGRHGSYLRFPADLPVAGRQVVLRVRRFTCKDASCGRRTFVVDALSEPQPRIPWVLDVDEYAMRKGCVYGTVLVDVETRCRRTDFSPQLRTDECPRLWPQAAALRQGSRLRSMPRPGTLAR
jgi:hypothetical protein